MFDFTERTELLIGRDALEKLARARVLLFGLGGVGGSCGEALVRAGIGHITAVDGDTVSLSNINRQVLALHSNVGMLKTEAFRRRALDINPALDIETVPEFYGRAERNSIDFSGFDHIVDCIDDVPAKVAIIVRAREAGVQTRKECRHGKANDNRREEAHRLPPPTALDARPDRQGDGAQQVHNPP